MSADKWHELVAELEQIEADIKRAMERFEARHNAEMDDMRREVLAAWANRLKAYRDQLAAKVEEDNK